MTDITKLLDEHPLPWTTLDGRDGDWSLVDADGRFIPIEVETWAGAKMVLALANALHAERQKNAAPAKRFDPPLNDSGDVDALRYRTDPFFKLIGGLERIVRDGERFKAIEKRLDAIANAARGSGE